MTTKVAVIGAAGRMGATVCEAVEGADDMELVGRFDAGDDLGDLGGADVVVGKTAQLDNSRNCSCDRFESLSTGGVTSEYG